MPSSYGENSCQWGENEMYRSIDRIKSRDNGNDPWSPRKVQALPSQVTISKNTIVLIKRWREPQRVKSAVNATRGNEEKIQGNK
jgi:hypothetical protein